MRNFQNFQFTAYDFIHHLNCRPFNVNATDEDLKRSCVELLRRATSIDQIDVDLVFEKICDDGLYDQDQSKWTDRSHYSEDGLLFLNSLTERFYATLSLSRPPKRRSWIMHAGSARVRTTYLSHVEFSSEVEDIPPPRKSHRDTGKPPISSTIQYRMQLGLPPHPLIYLIGYDWYGRIFVPIFVHEHPRTTLACIAALAMCDSDSSYETGIPWRIDLDSIQPCSDPSSWTKITTRKVVHSYQRHQSAEYRMHRHVKLRSIGPPTFGPVYKSLMPDHDDDPPAANYPHDGTQAQFLDDLKDVCGVPNITGYWSMTVDSRITHPLRLTGPRRLTVDSNVQIAEHLIDISFFASRQEFFKAMKSCIEAHRDAYSSHRLLHNNINLVSICLQVEDPNPEIAIPSWTNGTAPVRQAKLRNWEFAKRLDDSVLGTQLSTLRRLKYWEHFLATEILWDKSCVPRQVHDLESFLWVLLYICINHVGPYGQRSIPPKGAPGWLLPGRLLEYRLDICKERIRVQDWIFTCSYYFTPYFNHTIIVAGLGMLASEILPAPSTMTSEGNQPPSFSEIPVSYDWMIFVLQNIIGKLPDEEPPSEDVVQKAREVYRCRQHMSSEGESSKNGCDA